MVPGNERPMALTRAVLEQRFTLTHLAFLLLLWEHPWGLYQLWHVARVALGRKGTSGPSNTWGHRTVWAPTARRAYKQLAVGGGRPQAVPYGARLGSLTRLPPGSAQARPWSLPKLRVG